MRASPSRRETPSPVLDTLPPVAAPAVDSASACGLASGLLAAWAGAGSLGFLAPAVQSALVWLFLGGAVLALWPGRKAWLAQGWIALATLAVVVAAALTDRPLIQLLSVPIVLALLGRCNQGAARGVMTLAALAAMVLVIYRLALVTVTPVWMLADAAGKALGDAAGWLAGRPLAIGASFAGLDFLIVMLVVYCGWLAGTPRPRLRRALGGLVAIAGVHLAYLVILARADDLSQWLPPASAPPTPPAPTFLDQTPVWSWSDALRSLLPWNLPLLAGLGHALVAAMAYRWSTWSAPVVWDGRCEKRPAGDWPRAAGRPAVNAAPDASGGPSVLSAEQISRRPWSVAADIAAPVLALACATVAALAWVRTDLTDRTLLVYDAGQLDWSKAEHERYGRAAGSGYGLLPTLVAGLGGQWQVSAELTAADLEAADAVLVVDPLRPWPDERRQRLLDYVAGGGTLIVAAGTARRNGDDVSSAAELLEPTHTALEFDTVFGAGRAWSGCLEPSFHPVTSAAGEPRVGLTSPWGASLRSNMRLKPLLVGRWGWSKPGRVSAPTAVRYEAGDALGDLILAGEERFGRGRIVTIGNPALLANETLPGAYEVVGRLLGYACRGGMNPLSLWHQICGTVGLILLIVALTWRPKLSRIASTVIVLGGALWGYGLLEAWLSAVSPDGRRQKPNNLVYLDAAHLNAHAGMNWSDAGLTGLANNLVRNGYLPLLLPELTPQRLQRAAMLVTIAPRREYSRQDRQAVAQFVRDGGVLVIMVGAEDVGPSTELLADFGFQIPPSPAPLGADYAEPEPLGAFFRDYLASRGSRTLVLFHAGWEVRCKVENASVRVRGPGDRPVIITRQVEGKGVVAVIGDSQFAWNVNLEHVEGQPIQGSHGNAHFWRWFLRVLFDQQPEWIPPDPPVQRDSAAEAKAETKPQSKPAAKPEGKPEAKPESKPEPESESKPEVTPSAEKPPLMKPATAETPPPEAKPETKPEAKVEAKPQAKAQADAKSEVKPQAKSKPDAKTEAKPPAKPAAETTPEKSAAKPDVPAPKPDAQPAAPMADEKPATKPAEEKPRAKSPEVRPADAEPPPALRRREMRVRGLPPAAAGKSQEREEQP